MTLDRPHDRFQTTCWTLIHDLSGDGDQRLQAADELMRRYWPAVYAFLRRAGKGAEQAQELTQAFFADVVIGRDLLERADPGAGRLRSLILTALKRYLIDQHRRTRSRGEGSRLPLDAIEQEERAWSSGDSDETDAFERRWAVAQLEEAMRRCESHYRSVGKPGHWEVFENRVLRPAVGGSSPTALVELAPRCGFRAPADAAAAVQVVRKRALALLHEVVGESVCDPGEMESEYRDTLRLLGV